MKVILCLLGIHNWDYSMKKLESDRLGFIKFRHRKCKICDKEQIFSKRPLTGSGFGDNSWSDV